MRIAPVLLIASLTLFACGGSVSTPPSPEDAGAPSPLDGGSEATPTAPDAGACWRCADRAWRNTCVVPAQVAPDAESCLHCGEHCVSDPTDGAAE